MKYRLLGNSSLNISELCLGTMTWGEQNSEREGHEQLDEAISSGINVIDTAEMYPVPPKKNTYTRTESIIGSWLTPSKRREIILATKVSGPSQRLDWIRNGKNDLNHQHIAHALEESLKRLRTDYIDLYQLHWPSRKTNFFGKLGYVHSPEEEGVPLRESLNVLGKLIQQGKIRAYGLSNETPWGLMTCVSLAKELGIPQPVSVQNPYSLLNRTFEIGNAEICHRENIGLLAYSPLGFGVLTGKYLKGNKPPHSRLALFGKQLNRYSNNHSMSAANHYHRIALKYGYPPAQLAIAYTLSKPFLASTIIGATTLTQLRENIESHKLQLDPSAIEDIEKIHQRIPNPAP